MATSEDAVRATVRAWLTAIADADGESACALMDEAAKRQLDADRSCADAVRRIGEALGPDGRAELHALAVDEVTFDEAGRAVAALRDKRLGLRRSGERWLIADLMSAVRTTGGGAYPPPPTSFLPTPPPSRDA